MVSFIQWQSVNFSSLKIEEWDGEFTVFQPEAGKTHFLNRMSMQILSLLSQRSASTHEISHYLAVEFQQIPDKTFIHNIDEILQHFDTLGFVKKVK